MSVKHIPFTCSFDVVDQKIEICLNKLYKDCDTVNNITRKQMKRLLHYCVKLNHFYKRNVDDIFLVFNDRDDSELFLEFINCQHSNIKFTLETEKNDCLSVLIMSSDDGVISTTLFRKKTFSGLLMQYDSFVPMSYKKSLINGLIHRAWKICSSEELF